MSLRVRWLLLCGLLAFVSLPALAEEKKEVKPGMTANPFYTNWANAKKGSVAIVEEKSSLKTPEAKQFLDGEDVKTIKYTLLEINPRRVVVETVVTERENLGLVEAAPTKHIYPAEVRAEHLARIMQQVGAKEGKGAVMVAGQNFMCKTITGTVPGGEGAETEYTVWLSDKVPGSVVKQVRKAKVKGEVVAETTTLLQSFKNAE